LSFSLSLLPHPSVSGRLGLPVPPLGVCTPVHRLHSRDAFNWCRASISFPPRRHSCPNEALLIHCILPLLVKRVAPRREPGGGARSLKRRAAVDSRTCTPMGAAGSKDAAATTEEPPPTCTGDARQHRRTSLHLGSVALVLCVASLSLPESVMYACTEPKRGPYCVYDSGARLGRAPEAITLSAIMTTTGGGFNQKARRHIFM